MRRTFLYFNIANQLKFCASLIFIFFCISAASAQVGIGTEIPHSSSLLELSSTTKGFLVPRMEEAQKNAISSPAQGLLIFQTNGTVGFYSYDGTNWLHLIDGSSIETSGTITAGAITIPNTDGSANQVLKTDGSGTLSWTTPSPSILYQKTHSDVILTGTATETITLSLPAGSYIVTYTGKAYKSSGGAEYVASRIATTIPGSNLGGGDAIMIDSGVNDGRAYVVHQLGITLASAGSVSVYANTVYGSSDTMLTGARLTALTVGAVINQ